MNLFGVILAIFLTLQVTSQHPLDDERRLIIDFLSQLDALNGKTYDRSLKETTIIFEETLKQIPIENRGALSASLQKFIDDANRVQHNSTNAEKKAILDVVNTIPIPRPSAVYNPETMRVGSAVFPVLLAVKAIDDERATEILKATADLKSRLSQEGFKENQQLFNLLASYEKERDDKYLTELLALKQEIDFRLMMSF